MVQTPSYWIEITSRRDIGVDLNAPAADKNGNPHWSYDTIHDVRPGDLIYHYDANRKAIVGVSRAVGKPWSDAVYWAARGTRSRGIQPHLQPGWYLGLESYRPLTEPLTTAKLTARRAELFALRDELQRRSSTPVRFPFIPYRPDEVRALQAYLTPFPPELVDLFPQLAPPGERQTPMSGFGGPYRLADEQTAVGERDPFAVDPALVERALRGHAATQNALARFIKALSSEPLSPVGDDPPFDLAWRHGGIVYVAEIKSRTAGNEERQMRLGLGQVLRYRQILRRTHEVVRAVLVLEAQPLDLTWRELCASLDVLLCWAPAFDGLETSATA